jgi:penicillin-binding protein 2
MYKQRLQIFIFLCVLAIFTCVGRLAYLQLVEGDEYRKQIEQMRILPPMQLPTIRGGIFDRNGNSLAIDRPAFYLYVNYELTRLLDDRFWQGSILTRTAQGKTPQQTELELREEFKDEYAGLWQVIDKCSKIRNCSIEEISTKIRKINNHIWDMREFFAWLDKFPKSELKARYRAKGQAVPVSEALADFEKRFPDSRDRLALAMKVDLKVMHEAKQLMELKTETELLEAQLAFVNMEMVEILPEAKRVYPHGSAACQVIGWVGPALPEDKSLFADDDYSRYLDDELAGKDGVEKVCETILRGKRGEVVYDIDSELIERRETQFGKDVVLSLDIELQKEIEAHLSDPNVNPNYDSAIGAVVIDVATGDILSLVSMPVYDLTDIRGKYNKVRDAPGAPLVSKAIYEIYPPGSVIKPFILIAGLEEGKVGPTEIINCPHEKAPYGWPNCMQFNEFDSCHDWRWEDEGGNIARNAIRGSCNVYFSRLADRLAPPALQGWLFKFGYGREILPAPIFSEKRSVTKADKSDPRNLGQSAGQISTTIPRKTPKKLEDYPKIAKYDMRMFGIGESGLRATVLQVANGMAAIARGGIFKKPRLFPGESDLSNEHQEELHVAGSTLKVVREGMSAVVSEPGGTAYSVFRHSGLRERDIEIHGKTGSTEGTVNAWFGGFAEDGAGRVISVAVVVEGGKSGSRDAAPLARDIIRLCNEAGYIGKKPAAENAPPDTEFTD